MNSQADVLLVDRTLAGVCSPARDSGPCERPRHADEASQPGSMFCDPQEDAPLTTSGDIQAAAPWLEWGNGFTAFWLQSIRCCRQDKSFMNVRSSVFGCHPGASRDRLSARGGSLLPFVFGSAQAKVLEKAKPLPLLVFV